MVNVIYIDGIKLLVSTVTYKTIFQISQLVGKNIPHFCYNKRLAIAGNCRICLVEVQGLPKPIASCATPVNDNMVIFTKSPLVLKARESVMEFILINHPLDCPVCDWGGECDLQELSLLEGREVSRFFVQKRAVSDKIISSTIKTKMTRCIHCTKCVRLSFVMGMSTMGVASRGNSSEIFDYNYVSPSKKNSFLISNIVDICPVNWSLPKKKFSLHANLRQTKIGFLHIGKIKAHCLSTQTPRNDSNNFINYMRKLKSGVSARLANFRKRRDAVMMNFVNNTNKQHQIFLFFYEGFLLFMLIVIFEDRRVILLLLILFIFFRIADLLGSMFINFINEKGYKNFLIGISFFSYLCFLIYYEQYIRVGVCLVIGLLFYLIKPYIEKQKESYIAVFIKDINTIEYHFKKEFWMFNYIKRFNVLLGFCVFIILISDISNSTVFPFGWTDNIFLDLKRAIKIVFGFQLALVGIIQYIIVSYCNPVAELKVVGKIGAVVAAAAGTGIAILEGYTAVTRTVYTDSTFGQEVQQELIGYKARHPDDFNRVGDFKYYTKFKKPLPVDADGFLIEPEIDREIDIGKARKAKEYEDYLEANPIPPIEKIMEDFRSDNPRRAPTSEELHAKFMETLKTGKK